MPITYTNEFINFLNDLRALLRTEFANIPILLGDENMVTNMDTIVIEPIRKSTNSEATTQKKDLTFVVSIMIYLLDANQENAQIRLTDLTEHVEQLLLNNKKYPTDSGASWHNSEVDVAEYGQTHRGGQFIRVTRIGWSAVVRKAL